MWPDGSWLIVEIDEVASLSDILPPATKIASIKSDGLTSQRQPTTCQQREGGCANDRSPIYH